MTNGRNFELIDAQDLIEGDDGSSLACNSLGTFPDVESALAMALQCGIVDVQIRPLRPARPRLTDVLSLLEEEWARWAQTLPDEDPTIAYTQDEEATLRQQLDDRVNRVLDELLGHREIAACDFAGPFRMFSFNGSKWIEGRSIEVLIKETP